MTPPLTKEIKFTETQSPTKKMLSLKQIEFLHLCQTKLSEANQYFYSIKEDKITQNIEPIAKQIYKKLATTPIGDWELVKLENVLDMDVKSIVSYAKYEGFDKEGIEKILTGVIANRILNFAYFKNSGISLTVDPNFATYHRQKKLETILNELHRYGFITVDNFYSKYPAYYKSITEADTLEDLHAVELQADSELQFKKEDQIVLKKIKSEIKSRSKAIKISAHKEVVETKDQKAETYYKALEENLAYLRYITPKNELGQLASVAENTIRAIAKIRDSLEFTKLFATSQQLAELFWPIRLGRKIKGAEKLGLNRRLIEKYEKKIFDHRLRTELAAYWFEKKTTDLPRYQITPELALLKTIKNTLDAHKKFFRRSSEPVNLMVLVNDYISLKLKLPPDASDQDILMALKDAQIQTHNLSLLDRYELKRQSYKTGKKNKLYEDFYKQKEKYHLRIMGNRIDLPFEHSVDGDYIIRLTTKGKHSTQDKNSPFSLFAVDEHKALIDLDLNTFPGINLSVKFSHKYSDAKSTKPFFAYLFSRLKADHNNLDQITLPQMNFLHKIDEIKQPQELLPSLPIFEATTSITFNDNYEKFVLTDGDEKNTLSPNIIRTAVLDFANNVYDSHVLFAAKVNPQTAGPYDNIQPVILSLYPIKEIYEKYKANPNIDLSPDEIQTVKTWIKRTNEAVENAKKGLSTAAVLAAPLGRVEDMMAGITEVMHKGTNLVKRSSGMFSPLPETKPQPEFDDTIFYTAVSDTYEHKADLNKPKNSIGAIGYNHTYVDNGIERKDQATYAIRKTPFQAVAGFKKFVELELLSGVHLNRNERLINVNNIITKLLEHWENLIIGRINLDDYLDRLEDSFNKLRKESACGINALESAGITSPALLQRQLNLVLRQDAASTISRERIDSEKAAFYGFLNKVNQQSV